MNPTFKIFLDTRSRKADGSHPIAIRLTFKRKSTTISTGHSAFADEWNTEAVELKPSKHRDKPATIRINKALTKRKGEITTLFQKLEVNGGLSTILPKKLFSLVSAKAGTDTNFLDAITDHRKELLRDGKYANHGHFESTYNVLKHFVGKEQLPVNQINLEFIERFERWYLSQQIKRHGETKRKCHNGLAPHLRRIRALLNRLIKDERISEEVSPFKKYKIKTEKTVKRSLNIEQINKLAALQLEPYTSMWHAKNYFMASFYMQGIAPVDLARLRLRSIANGVITYRRSKTNQLISIKVDPKLQTILDEYICGKGAEDFIFPILKPNVKEEKVRHYVRSASIKINDNLRKLSRQANLNEPFISLYWARHSYATCMKREGAPTEVISQSLGHENLETTKIYLRDLDINVVAGYSDKVFQQIVKH